MGASDVLGGGGRSVKVPAQAKLVLDGLYVQTYICIMVVAERPVVWVGSSRRDSRGFPREVRRDIGRALYAAQEGETDPATKPMRGFGGGSVVEIITYHRGDTWRTVYTVRFAEGIYVLHAFQKKSKSGIATSKRDTELIRLRLAEAERLHRERAELTSP